MKTSDLISRYDVACKLHEAGGCDAPKDSWADGWDRAITEAISIVMSMPGKNVKKRGRSGKSSR